MKSQIAVVGRGGQGVLFLTRILAECALEAGFEVMASETHGMAQRGGSVISTIKVGPFKGSLIGSGRAEAMLVLDEGSLDTFIHLLSPQGALFLNAPGARPHPAIDATGIAAAMGSPLMANLVLLGFALEKKKLFCEYPRVESVTEKISPARFREANLQALRRGYAFPS